MIEIKQFLETSVYIDGLEAENVVLGTEMTTTAIFADGSTNSPAKYPLPKSKSGNDFASNGGSLLQPNVLTNAPLLVNQKQVPDVKKYKTRQKFLVLAVVLLLLLVIAGGIGVYFLAFTQRNTESPDTATETMSTLATTTKTTKTISRTAFPRSTVTTVIRDRDLLEHVYGLTIDDDDNLYVAVTGPYQRPVLGYPIIYRVDQGFPPSLTLIANLSTDGQGLSNRYQGLCYFNKALYVPRMGQLTKIDLANNNMVTRFSGKGVKGRSVPGFNSSAVFDGITHCVADKDGTIYVSGEGNDEVITMVSQTGYADILGYLRTSKPFGLVLNGSDSLLFSSWSPATLNKVDINNFQVETVVGSPWSQNSTLEGPNLLVSLGSPGGMAFDEIGNLYFTDGRGNYVLKVNLTNHVSIFAGSSRTGIVNGLGIASSFNSPRQIVFDSKGRLFVTDQTNAAVRMINW